MQPISTGFSRFLLISLIVAFITSGCASFAGRELPIYTKEQVSAPAKKISATYDVKAFGVTGGENNMAAAGIDKEIQKILSTSPIFSEFKPGAGPGDHHYSFTFRNEGSPPLPIAFLNGFISGFTFTLIPAYARDIFIITIDVKQGDRVLKTYTYRDHMDSWIQLFMVFLAPGNWPPTVSDTVIDNMLMNFAYDLGSDIESGVYLAKQN
ncbi:MAG: hypothetical protein A2X58_11800 [Nitrospirae bacterium GWC2_56_14]|nr:MAG: hypothetical protein A2X58_11800 [Nitrospirae bacterium GWC2_56_14]